MQALSHSPHLHSSLHSHSSPYSHSTPYSHPGHSHSSPQSLPFTLPLDHYTSYSSPHLHSTRITRNVTPTSSLDNCHPSPHSHPHHTYSILHSHSSPHFHPQACSLSLSFSLNCTPLFIHSTLTPPLTHSSHHTQSSLTLTPSLAHSSHHTQSSLTLTPILICTSSSPHSSHPLTALPTHALHYSTFTTILFSLCNMCPSIYYSATFNLSSPSLSLTRLPTTVWYHFVGWLKDGFKA